MVTVPVAGKPTRLDITNEIRAACESLVPPVSETMLELVSRVEPEYQEKVRHNITLAGGGSQIFGLGAGAGTGAGRQWGAVECRPSTTSSSLVPTVVWLSPSMPWMQTGRSS